MSITDGRAEQMPSPVNATGDRALTAANNGPADNDAGWQNAYSLSSPELRQSLVSQAAEQQSIITAPVDKPISTEAGTAGAKPTKAPDVVPTAGVNSTASGEDIHDLNRTVDPCHKTMTMHFLPGDEPKAMDLVKDRDPDLYNQIKGKVKDPRYIGQNGDITVSTHDKKGHINGCTFIQNTPYWLSADAAKSYLGVNKQLDPLHKKIEVDHLNGAGRTLGQEEGIAWRNTGVHAKPGKSNHGFGRAIDLQDDDDAPVQPSDDKDIREALHANGFRQGDSHGPLKNDLHHWSYNGPGRATDGHAIVPKIHRKHHKEK